MSDVNYWKGDFKKFFSLGDELRRTVVHPYISKLLNDGESVLDYGCGQGDLLSSISLSGEVKYTGYDPSDSCINEAIKQHSVKSNVKFISSLDSINEKFDAVILCFVIVTIDNIVEAKNVIKQAVSFLKKGGRLMICDTHPCFRDQVFSTLETNMNMDNYDKSYFPVDVKLCSNTVEYQYMEFTDYHKSLADISTLLSSESVYIHKIDEIYDVVNDANKNSVTAKRHRSSPPAFLYIEGGVG